MYWYPKFPGASAMPECKPKDSHGDGLKRILVVDDSSDDVTLLHASLSRAGVHCILDVAQSGEDAVERLSGSGIYSDEQAFPLPDLVLLDLKMPGMDGFEVLEWVRDRRELANLPVIAMSNIEVPAIRQQVTKMGATGYFVKSYGLSSLESIIRYLFFNKHHGP